MRRKTFSSQQMKTFMTKKCFMFSNYFGVKFYMSLMTNFSNKRIYDTINILIVITYLIMTNTK